MSGEGNHRAYISPTYLVSKSFQCVIAGIVDKKNISQLLQCEERVVQLKLKLRTIFDHFFSGDKCLRGLV